MPESTELEEPIRLRGRWIPHDRGRREEALRWRFRALLHAWHRRYGHPRHQTYMVLGRRTCSGCFHWL